MSYLGSWGHALLRLNGSHLNKLYETIYVSSRATGVTDQIIVDEIVLPAGARNRSLDITGCLWFSDSRFLQILEGPEQAVKAVFGSILRDPRHRDIVTLSSTPLTVRTFSRWNMRALTGNERFGIDELVAHYAPDAARERRAGINTCQQPEPLLSQIRSHLLQLAGADSTF